MNLRHITLQQMRLFATVVRHRSITRAAEEVHLTQPAVSIQVKRLEERIGLPLFETLGRSLHLTVAGQKVHAACRDVLQRLNDLENSLDNLRSEIAGPVRVAVVSSAQYFLPHLLGAFVRRHPKAEPDLVITNRAKLLSRLSGNIDDLYVMGQPPEGLPLAVYPFLENVLVVVARPNHPLAGEASIPLPRLLEERFVGRESGSGTRQAVERMFRKHGLELVPGIELDSTEAIKQGVMGGLGIAVLSLHALRPELKAGFLTILDVEGFPLRRQWYAVHREGKHLCRAAHAFLSFLREEGELEIAHLLTNNRLTSNRVEGKSL